MHLSKRWCFNKLGLNRYWIPVWIYIYMWCIWYIYQIYHCTFLLIQCVLDGYPLIDPSLFLILTLDIQIPPEVRRFYVFLGGSKYFFSAGVWMFRTIKYVPDVSWDGNIYPAISHFESALPIFQIWVNFHDLKQQLYSPEKLTWNLKITNLRRNSIFQTSMTLGSKC